MDGLLDHACTIRRNTPSNVDGVVTPAWANVVTGVPCLLQEGAGRVRYTSGGAGLEYDAILFLPAGTNIKPQAGDDQRDQVVMTTPAGGGTFLVKHVADESGQGHHLTAFLERLPAK